MAKKLGVSKSDILDHETDNMAVRLALAETNVINGKNLLILFAETKKYLEEAGVCLDAFVKRKERSKTTILVKNISTKTEESELINLFGKFGKLGRVILPNARTIALVEFLELNEAKTAFRKLAFSKQSFASPLYLEWAPVGTFTKTFDEADKSKTKPNIVDKNDPIDAISIIELEKEEPIATVFVKNLNFETTEQSLKSAFESLNGLRSVKIATKTDPKTRGKMSMGFGFLEFLRKEDAMTCIKTMQKYKLDGHELLLKFSTSTQNTSKSRKRIEDDILVTGTKLLVRNLPFEATKKDLKELFS